MQPLSIKRLKHGFIFIYPVIYMIIFHYLEKNVQPTHMIELSIDHKIPFCEYFIVPYFLWFLYVAVTVVFFFFHLDLGDFYRLVLHLFLGMTIFLVVSAAFPNGLDLRPTVFPRDNLFTDWVKKLYRTDTATNVLPSIHAYNSICVHIAIVKNQYLNKKTWITTGSFILMVLITLSTMFLKQHSVIDVMTGLLLSTVSYPLFYKKNWIPHRDQYPLPEKSIAIAHKPQF